MSDMQKILDTFGEGMRDVRSRYHLTLGSAIRQFKLLPPKYVVVIEHTNYSPGDEMSYRGYYSDLAFEPMNDGDPKSVEDFLAQLEHALNREYTGYKGGEFRMGDKTPLWISEYGTTSGIAIMSIHTEDGVVKLVTKEVD